ncbi:DsrE family protein [Candidatus Magnetobacterium casense]|uniref:DsrE family protein n=1 Tax=Candidatus Magnetobacterium casense TaxID=1455061 RepID=UPI00058FE3CD|nr:DsrE family protein [Candidatus Magnetobacterium casensis]
MVWLSFAGSPAVQAAPEQVLPQALNDTDALQGVTVGKVVFDIGMANPQTLPLYLKVITQTHADLERQQVRPDLVLAFRGKAVKLVSTNHEAFPMDQHPLLEEIASLIAELRKKPGVRMEVCGLATGLFGVDNTTILPGIKPVGNTFVSLTGYHAQGYAAIPIH